MVVSLERLGIRAEFERTTKMEWENESENDHFLVHFHLILNSIFEK